MPVQALTHVDPNQFFNVPSTNGMGAQRLETKVSGVAVSNEFSGRLSVTTAEGDTITLTADLESDFRAVSDKSHLETDGTTVDVEAKYAGYSPKQEFGVTVEGDLNEDEVKDLARLFRKVSNIFTKFFRGQDDEALAKTAKLAERFGNSSSLSSLDLSVDVERSVTVFAAQVASEVAGQPALPTSQQPQPSASTSPTVTPGGAPATVAEIPRPSTGTTAPTPPSTATPVAGSTNETHLSAPAQGTKQLALLVQQVMDALKDVKVEFRKIRKYLTDFIETLRKDLGSELRGERELKSDNHEHPVNQVQAPATTNTSGIFAYQAVRQVSAYLSIRS